MQTKKNLLFLVVTLCLILPTSTAFNANCTNQKREIKINCAFVKTVKYSNDVGDIKRCEADSAINSTISETLVNSILYRGKKWTASNQNIDVDGLWIDQADVKFIPTGINVAFPNLKALSIMGSGLLIVEKDNLQVFGENLVYVDFQKNRIRFLDAKLFESNKNLKVANFWDNAIEYIQADFFTNIKSLKQLQQLNLGSNKCMNQIFEESTKNNVTITVENFKWSNENCKNETAVTFKAEAEKMIDTVLCPDFHMTEAPPCDSVSSCKDVIEKQKTEIKILKKKNVETSATSED